MIIPNAPKNVSSDVFEAQIYHAVGAYKRAETMKSGFSGFVLWKKKGKKSR